MTQFRKVEPAAHSNPAPLPDIIQVPWLPPSSAEEVAAQLFEFLQMLRQGRLRATRSLVLENTALQSLYRHPPEILRQALCHQLDAFLVELGPNPGQWGDLQFSPIILGVVLAAYISLTPNLVPEDESLDLVLEFGTALVESLPPARSLPEMLAYHAILADMGEALPRLSPGRQMLLLSLFNRSPLSAAYHLHVHTPPPLTPLAAQLMPWWKRRVQPLSPWRGPEDWLQAILVLTAHPTLAIYLRRRWLSLPETRHSCRNLGLLFEALRRAGGQRDFLLTFYEAYERLCAQTVDHQRCAWPVLAETERLLRAGQAGSETSRQLALALNRRGNETFLKFYPLLEIIKTDGRPPTDYRLLTNDLILSLRDLTDWVTLGQTGGLKMGSVSFDGS